MRPLPLLWLLCLPCSGYPDGAPSCTSRSPNIGKHPVSHLLFRPNHGVKRKPIKLQVVRIAERKWKVTVDTKHRGLLLSTALGNEVTPTN